METKWGTVLTYFGADECKEVILENDRQGLLLTHEIVEQVGMPADMVSRFEDDGENYFVEDKKDMDVFFFLSPSSLHKLMEDTHFGKEYEKIRSVTEMVLREVLQGVREHSPKFLKEHPQEYSKFLDYLKFIENQNNAGE